MSQIEIDRVGRVFPVKSGQDFVALQDVSLTIEQGEFVLLLGPSGCGKSTLMRLIGQLDQATSGAIRIAGSKDKRGFEKVGVVFQQPVLLPWLTVRENVLYPARALAAKRARALRDRASELLSLTGLTRVADQLPTSISGGMQQRAAICRALVLDPDVLLMDEPFSALDAMTREELQFELLRIQKVTGKTIIFVTHSISEAVLLSTRIIVMAAGPGRIADDIRTELPFPRSNDTLLLDGARVLDTRIRGLIHGRPAMAGGTH